MPGAVSPKNPKLEAVYNVLIDDTGQFKYILCKVYDSDKPEEHKFIIRGGARYEFHCTCFVISSLSIPVWKFLVLSCCIPSLSADIYDELDSQLEEYGLVCECLGGGKILHEASQKRIEVFGKSQVRNSKWPSCLHLERSI